MTSNQKIISANKPKITESNPKLSSQGTVITIMGFNFNNLKPYKNYCDIFSTILLSSTYINILLPFFEIINDNKIILTIGFDLDINNYYGVKFYVRIIKNTSFSNYNLYPKDLKIFDYITPINENATYFIESVKSPSDEQPTPPSDEPPPPPQPQI